MITLDPRTEYMRPKDVEKAFGLKAGTVRKWVPARLKGARIGRTILVDVADLRARLGRVEAGEPWEIVFCDRSTGLPPGLSRAVAGAFGHCPQTGTQNGKGQ